MLESKRKLAFLMLVEMEKQSRFLDAEVERKMGGKAIHLVSNRMQSDKHDFLYDPRPGK